MLGTQDLLIGLVLAAFFFGAKRLPELARSLGQSMTEFKKGVSGHDGSDSRDSGTPAPLPSAESDGARPPAASSETAARVCPACQTALMPDWSHCPRCGAVAPQPAVPRSAS